jgi:hypothetical protein
MAERLVKESQVGEYIPYHFNAAQGDALIAADHTHGTFLGAIIVGTLGTTPTIKLGNGDTTTNLMSLITPTAPGFYPFQCVFDKGMHITLTGTGFDITILALPMAI